MKIAALILGVIGGIAGIFGSIMAIFVGGVGTAFELKDSSTIVGLGLAAIFLSLLGIVGGALAIAKPKAAGTMMLIGGIGGIIAISAGYIIAGPLLIIAGIFALMGAGKENKSDTQGAKQPTEIKKKNFTWAFWVLGIIVVLIVLSAIGSKTEENKTNTAGGIKASDIPIAGKWRADQVFKSIEFKPDGTMAADMFLVSSGILIHADGKYKLSGDSKIEFEITSAKILSHPGEQGQVASGDTSEEDARMAAQMASVQLIGMWDYYVSPSRKECTMTNSQTMQGIQLVRE